MLQRCRRVYACVTDRQGKKLVHSNIKGNAILADKIARAVYFMLQKGAAFDAERLIATSILTLASQHRSSLTPPILSPHGCLVGCRRVVANGEDGRPANRIQVGTRCSETEEAEERKSATEAFLCCPTLGAYSPVSLKKDPDSGSG